MNENNSNDMRSALEDSVRTIVESYSKEHGLSLNEDTLNKRTREMYQSVMEGIRNIEELDATDGTEAYSQVIPNKEAKS